MSEQLPRGFKRGQSGELYEEFGHYLRRVPVIDRTDPEHPVVIPPGDPLAGEVKTYENHAQDSHVREIDVSDTRSRKDGTGGNNLPLVLATFGKVGHAVNADGDGEKYAPVEVAQTLNTFQNQSDARAVDLVVEPSVCKTLSAEGYDGMPDPAKGNGQPVVAVRTANTHANGCGVAVEAGHTIDRAQGQAVAIGFKAGQSADGGLGVEAEVSPTMSHQPSALEPTVAVDIDPYNATDTVDAAATLGVNAGVSTGRNGVVLRHIVRRLTPTECERLQAFPDGWTKIPWRTFKDARRKGVSYEALLAERGMKLREPTTEECPDSPRYKALGNSWATNCAEWILRRIVAAVRLGLIDP